MQIRTGMRSSWLVAAAVLLTGTLALFPLGCGGGGGSTSSGTPGPGSTPTPAPTATPLITAGFKVKIEWGARSRVIGLSSALSARITLKGAAASGGDISWVVNRPPGTAEAAVIYDAPSLAAVGPHLLSVDFYTQADAAGDKVGFAQASASVTSDGSLTVTISTYNGVSSVEVIAGQVMQVGETKDLAFTAKNYAGTIVAVTPGSQFFTVVNGTSNLAAVNGGSSVQALRPISADVTVRVDSAVSKATTVAINSPSGVSVVPGSATIGSEFPLDLTATVNGLPSTATLAGDDEVVWSIPAGAGTDNGTLTNVGGKTVRYLAPYVSGSTVKTINLLATSKYDSTKTFTVPVTVNAPAVVVVTPDKKDLSLEESVTLTAVVNNLSSLIAADDAKRTVRWEVTKDGSNPVGTVAVDPANPNVATYTAPKREGTYTVTATSVYDGTKVASATITVLSQVGVTVIPTPTATLNWDETLDFTAIVARTPNQSVTWAVTSPAGFNSAISPTAANKARFTAPKQDGTYVVTVTSAYDTRKSTTVTIKVASKVAIDATPKPTASINWEDTIDFTATVSGLFNATIPANQSVTWSIVSPAGFDSALVSTGLRTARFTAPKVNGRYVVRATSNYDTRRFIDIPVDVSTNIAVSVAPDASPNPVLVSIRRTKNFQATLTGLPPGRDGSVSFVIVGPNDEPNTGNIYGTLTTTSATAVVYNAPGTVPGTKGTGDYGRLKIIATSNYDTNAKKAVTVKVVEGSLGIGIN